jgi:GNAT superfamily N-acetyltransferase
MTQPRLAVQADLDSLPHIERSAAGRFATSEIPSAAELPVSPASAWVPALQAGTLWVIEEEGQVVGFLAATAVGEALHIEEIDVRVDRQGRGYGRKLMEAALARARALGLREVTLTTFRDIPWNGPFYRSFGFVEVSWDTDARLAGLRAKEQELGLDLSRRCAMALSLL